MQENLKDKTAPRPNKNAVPMRKQSSKTRIQSFDEVAIGYSETEASQEANRCLSCPKPQCVKGCPVGVDIPAFIKLVKEKKFSEGSQKIKEKNTLPAVCGRVCPQEEQCQKFCILGKKDQSVSIGRLERFVADFELEKGVEMPALPKPSGGKVAVIGSGPAGLTVGAELGKTGP